MERDLLGDLSQQGVAVQPASAPARKVALGDRAGAEQRWRGQTQNGDVTVWCGALVEREYYLAVIAIVMGDKQAQYLPGAKRMFRTMEPKAPEPNPELERGLAGASFSSGGTVGSSGSLHTIYTFGDDGSVRRQTIMSGSTGGADVGGDWDARGRYRAVGKIVYLQFRDGQQVARAEGPAAQPTGLRLGDQVYRRR
jgi:hypothetical protein